MNATAVTINDVSVKLGESVWALQSVSATLSKGKIIGFIGPSGAGKTTLIRAIVGRQRITSGGIAVFGQPAGSADLRKEISYMTQDVSVYSDLTAEQNVAYFGTMFGFPKKTLKKTVRDILETVDLTPQAKQLVRTLSGGQKQRVSLASSLVGNPKLLVLDEPTVGLDPVLREQMWKLFRGLAKNGTTIIISSHVMDESERCDELLFIREGKILASGSPDSIAKQTDSKTLEQSFLKLAGDTK